MPRRIESHMLAGPAGRLEALLEEPENAAPIETALVCHPHPQHGGTMHNKVVYRLARGLRRNGIVVLRFNYRGVNLSEGAYGHGDGELEDARAALAWLRARYPDLPVTLAGFSFGARVVLRLACESAGISRVIAVGFPAAYRDALDLSRCMTPKVFLHSTNDQFGSVEEITQYVRMAQQPAKLQLVESGDHFFAGALDGLEAAVFDLGLTT
jgi:uncharacterized protein